MDSLWWSLSGGGRFLRAVADDLQAGTSCCLVLPNTLDGGSLRSALRARVRERQIGAWEAVALREETLGPPAEVIAQRLGLPANEPGQVLGAQYLAWLPAFSGFIIWLEGLERLPDAVRQRWLTFLKEFAHLSRHRLPVERSVFCIVVRGPSIADLPESNVLLRIRWWWNVIGRLDVALFIHEQLSLSDTGNETAEPVMVELAGFDPELAELLFHQPQEEPEALVEQLRGYACARQWATVPLDLNHLPYAQTLSREGPATLPAPLRDAWSLGQLNWLAGQLVIHSAVLAQDPSPRRVMRRIWSAQVRTWLPFVDEQRIRICDYLTRTRGAGWLIKLEGTESGDEMLIEIGRLKYLFDSHPDLKREPEAIKELVRWLHAARNDLSHLALLTRTELQLGLELVERASEHL